MRMLGRILQMGHLADEENGLPYFIRADNFRLALLLIFNRYILPSLRRLQEGADLQKNTWKPSESL
jgi:hypothetical protein